MSPKLYNSLTRRVEPLETIEPGKVRMYCCGVTVYDNCHLGHARSYIAWDVVRRYLTWRGYEVRYVQNFTDIDDKILNRARQEGSSMEEVAERYTQTYFEDMKRLNVLEADEYPRATHTMDGIKRLIHELESKGYAYASGGDVYYKVRQFSEYGKLSGRKFDEMQAGASGRVESEDAEAQKKKDPFDFALWKGAKSGEPAWDSPWGSGRPGWHIECSAMVRQSLGETIDIHCGGADLIFPHHENEIAQSEAVTGKPLARYWMHNGFVTVNGEKMSKSLGNFTTIRDLLDRPTDPMVVRLLVLMAHYRKPIDFTAEAMESAKNGWNTIKEGLVFGYEHGFQFGWDLEKIHQLPLEDSEAVQQFQAAMDDDFNTPNALAVVFDLAKELGRDGKILRHGERIERSAEALQQKWQTLVKLLVKVLGFTYCVNMDLYGDKIVRNTIQKGMIFGYEHGWDLQKVQELPPEDSEAVKKFEAAIDDDFNIPNTLAILFELAKELQRNHTILVDGRTIEIHSEDLQQKWHTLVKLAKVVGFTNWIPASTTLFGDTSKASLEPEVIRGLKDEEIEALIQQRLAARKAKNFAEGDRIRNELKDGGITLIDQKDGTTIWHRN